MTQPTAEEIEETQKKGLIEWWANETRQLLELSKVARMQSLTATPQTEQVRQVLYSNFMAAARIWYRKPEEEIPPPS